MRFVAFRGTRALIVILRYVRGQPDMHSYDFSPTVAALNIVLAKFAVKNGGINVGKNRYFFPSGAQSQGSFLGASRLLIAYRGLSHFVSLCELAS